MAFTNDDMKQLKEMLDTDNVSGFPRASAQEVIDFMAVKADALLARLEAGEGKCDFTPMNCICERCRKWRKECGR